MRRSQILEIKRTAYGTWLRISLASILKYYPILHVVKKIIKLASKNSVKLGEDQLVISGLSNMDASGHPFPVDVLHIQTVKWMLAIVEKITRQIKHIEN